MSAPPQPSTADAGGTAAAEPILRLERINKWFPVRAPWYRRAATAGHHVLKDVSLVVARGEVLVVIGPSGSGKSTLLRCINMLTPAESGTIGFMGRNWDMAARPGWNPLAKLRRERELLELRARIGMVFQQFNLFPHKTVLRNVMLAPMRVLKLPAAAARERAMAELERVGIADKANAYPSQLSGGQKQRVAIARALAMRTEVMLFDEATSALDPELIEGILEEMKKLALAGMTMIVVTHEMGFAREVGDRIVFMDDGRVIEEGPARTLLSAPRNPRTQAFLRSIL